MTTMDRYVTRTFIGSYILLLAVGFALYVFSDVLVNIDEFTKDRTLTLATVLLNMADYYGHNLLLYYMQLGGAMMMFAASFTFAMMLKNNELTPLIASGVPLQRVALPVFACSVFLMVAWMVNNEVLVPHYADQIARQHDDLSGARQVDVPCVRDDHNAVLVAQELRVQSGRLVGIYIVEPDEHGAPKQLIRADAATYDAGAKTWRLERGARQVMGTALAGDSLGRAIQWQPLADYAFTLSPEQILLRQSSQWADLMSIRQMNALLATHNLPNLPAIAKSRDIRFTLPLLAWILMLLAVPYFLTREPGNVLVAGAKALLACGVFFSFVFIVHGMSAGTFTTLTIWLPVLLFGPLAVVHFANMKT
jgi:lipopolysaccharide export LptBFGC system permease protein LptF